LVDRSTVATTVITMYEQLRGRLAAINRKQSDAQLQLAFRHLQATQQYYCTARILPFVEKATQIHQTLVTQKARIGSQDLQIAAIVLAHHAVLVTANQRHFAQVPDLQIEDWTRK
jgi:tRNA(fMet)-specific endonuclease VapC